MREPRDPSEETMPREVPPAAFPIPSSPSPRIAAVGDIIAVFLCGWVIGLVAAILAPIVAGIVQAAVSRQREYLADATGALTTRHPDALASALLKLQEYGRPVTKTNTSMSHLWISDPNKPGVMSRLFSTHPPIADRVARLTEAGRTF